MSNDTTVQNASHTSPATIPAPAAPASPAFVPLSQADARAAFAARCLSMFDSVATQVAAMANETRVEFDEIETRLGTPRVRELTEKHPTETEVVKVKNADGSKTEKIVAKRVPKLDANGKVCTVTVTDAPDLTLMICEALASTGDVVVQQAGRTAGLWKGKIAKNAPSATTKELAATKSALLSESEKRNAAEAQLAALQEEIAAMKARLASGKKSK